MGSQQDRDEAEFHAPVLSVSLGDTAIFHVGAAKRSHRKSRVELQFGDVLVTRRRQSSRVSWHRSNTCRVEQSADGPDFSEWWTSKPDAPSRHKTGLGLANSSTTTVVAVFRAANFIAWIGGGYLVRAALGI